MLDYSYLERLRYISVQCERKYNNFHLRNWIWKTLSANRVPFLTDSLRHFFIGSLRYHCLIFIRCAMHAHSQHDDVIKWKHFPRNRPFVRGIHRSPVNPAQGPVRGALIFSWICVWINGWVYNCEAGDLRRYRAHYDAIVMNSVQWMSLLTSLQKYFIYT